jgi:hypothetical protein
VAEIKLIVSEGPGDLAFFKKLIEIRKLENFKLFKRTGGEPEGAGSFERILKSITVGTEYAECGLIVIVADNDVDPVASFRQILKQIKAAREFAIPERPREVATKEKLRSVSVLMLPWDDVPGDLETVCFDLASRARPKIARCVGRYVKCVKAEPWSPSQLSKLRLRCLIAASCPKDPNTGLPHAWKTDQGRRPRNLIPLQKNGAYLGQIVEYLRQLP